MEIAFGEIKKRVTDLARDFSLLQKEKINF